MKLLTTAAGFLALSALPAHAHDGDHSVSFVANVLHWLSSPSHSLFAVIGGLAVAAIIVKIARKRA